MNYLIIVLKLVILKSLKVLFLIKIELIVYYLKSIIKKYLENINGMDI